MNFAIGFLPKKRNNSPTNLAIGICSGFNEIGFNALRIELGPVGEVPLGELNGVQNLVIPYWISKELFNLNLAEVKKAHPEIKIVTYTGTSPYWNGCPWVCLDDAGKLTPGSEATERTIGTLSAIDLFATVWSSSFCQREVVVGMGQHSELAVTDKPGVPCVLLDFFKTGWDEAVFDECVRGLASWSCGRDDAIVLVLGRGTLARAQRTVGEEACGSWHLACENTYTEYATLVSLYQQAWAVMIHNESFGFPVHEAHCCGAQTFASARSELPTFYGRFTRMWKSADDLTQQLNELTESYTQASPQAAYERWKSVADVLHLRSWQDAASRIVTAVQRP